MDSPHPRIGGAPRLKESMWFAFDLIPCTWKSYSAIYPQKGEEKYPYNVFRFCKSGDRWFASREANLITFLSYRSQRKCTKYMVLVSMVFFVVCTVIQ